MLSNVLRGIKSGASSLGRAVAQAVKQPEPQSAPAQEQLPQTTQPMADFTLPDLGPGPDPKSPEFQGEAGQKALAKAMEHYQHQQEIHQAFTELDDVYSKAHPDRDFRKEYADQVAAMQQHDQERPAGNALARGALALGDFNPAVRGSNVERYDERVEKEGKKSDSDFAQRMSLRARSHQAAADEAESKGNWKKALAEKEKLALLKLDEQEREREGDLAKVDAQQRGATERANIKATAMENTATIRASTIAATHDLTGSFEQMYKKEAAKAVAKFLGPRDLTKEYTPADLDSLSTYLEHLAEMFHDQQYGTDDGGAARGRRHPSKRTPAPDTKTTTKEEF